MIASLLRQGGLWVATWVLDGRPCMHACEDRQGAAWALYDATGVWLGLGPAPTTSIDRVLADYAEVAHGS